MAEASNAARKRPLSPHLGVWRWSPAMTVSILHRVSGIGLAKLGLPLLLWWLGALAYGPAAYETLVHWVWAGEVGRLVQTITNVLGRVALVGLSWALFEHTLSGLRHYVLDTGAGYELDANRFWSWAVLIGAPVLTIAFWAVLLFL
ncbi:MAG TPA: succinate dehydrogenase, cytochrome b556 subunit [Novosphingobium sp.]|nr:succinate dehydrogenase, cytochrome b556 subunit [Novosphingobium sp.]